MQGHEAWNWGSSNLEMQRSLELLAFSEVMRAEGPTDGRTEGDEILGCGHHMAWLMKQATLDVITGSGVFTFWTNFVVQSLSHSRLFVTPWMAAHQASLSFTVSWSLLKLMSTESVMSSSHLILCSPLLLLPSILPSIRVFSSELAFHIRWPKCWSFCFSISLSSKYSGLISFKIDWFDPLAVQGTLLHCSLKVSVLWCSAFFIAHIHTRLLEKAEWAITQL